MTDITKPRRYVLAGAPLCSQCGVSIAEHPDVEVCESRGSIALAVLGDMLENAEAIERESAGTGATHVAIQRAIVATLRVARERVASAEAGR